MTLIALDTSYVQNLSFVFCVIDPFFFLPNFHKIILLNLCTASCFSNQSKEAFADWARHDDAQDHFCELDGETQGSGPAVAGMVEGR